MKLPNDPPIESLTAGMIGLWVAIHVVDPTTQQHEVDFFLVVACLCGSLAQCALSLKRLSAGPGFNPQTRQNKWFHDYWCACFEINFSDRQEGLTVSSIICDR